MKLEENVYKKHLLGWQLLAATLTIGLIAVFADAVMLHAENEALRNMNELLLEIDYSKYQDYKESKSTKTVVVVEPHQDVMFTNYFVGDGSTTSKTGSGLSTNDFEINEYGFYTFNDKVVLATATEEGLQSSFGVLVNYKVPADDIEYYKYFDEVIIEIGGNQMEGIVLDTCGSCMAIQDSDYGLNRVDVFVGDKSKAFGKVKGKVYENN